MRCPRLTTRRIMAAILVLAVGLGLGVPAVRVATDRGDHDHYWPVHVEELSLPGWAGGVVKLRQNLTLYASLQTQSPFWPRYWRCLAGRPWRQVPVCELDGGQPGETCAYERPEPIVGRNDLAPTRKAH